MLALANKLHTCGAGVRVVTLGGGDVDTATPTGSMLFTIIAALAPMEHEIKHERVFDPINKRREAGQDLGGRPRRITDSQICTALHLIEGGNPAAPIARDFGMS